MALNGPRSLSLSKDNFRRLNCSCANSIFYIHCVYSFSLFYFFIYKLTKEFYSFHIVCNHSQRVRVLTLEGVKAFPSVHSLQLIVGKNKPRKHVCWVFQRSGDSFKIKADLLLSR